MPLPFLIGAVVAKVAIGAGVAAGVAGAGTAIHGGVKMKRANDTAKSAESRNNKNEAKFKTAKDETTESMDNLGELELRVMSSFERFSELFEKIKNKPKFGEMKIEGVDIPEYDPKMIKEVSVGAAAALGGLGSAAVGTAGGFAASGAAYAAVMTLGTASTGTAISTLSGAAATKATLAALGGGALKAGGGGIALGTTVLGTATVGVGLLAGGFIFHHKATKVSEKADEAWKLMLENEKEINKICAYLDDLRNLADNYYVSINSVNNVYIEHLDILDRIVNKEGRCDYREYSADEKLKVKNTSNLVKLLYSMCKVNLVIENTKEGEMNTVNTKEATEQMEISQKAFEAKGFENSADMYSVFIKKKINTYYIYLDPLSEILPIDKYQASDLADKLDDCGGITIARSIPLERADDMKKSVEDKCSNVEAFKVDKANDPGYPIYKELIQ